MPEVGPFSLAKNMGVAKLIQILAKVDIAGLIIYVFNRGVKDSEAER